MLTNKIKKKADFYSVFKSKNFLSQRSFTIQYANRINVSNVKEPRYGIIASKKVGNAVKRNYAKRRVRAMESIISSYGGKNIDYVLVIKKKFVNENFNKLNLDLKNALIKIKKITE